MNTRILQILGVIVFAVSVFAMWYFWDRQEYHLRVAAGQSSGQAFKLMKAAQSITNRHFPEIKIDVFETRGSLQNARLLDRGRVDLATARSDMVLGNRAQLVAELYSDVFQLVVRRTSHIAHVADLRGKRIALPPERSGAHESFWFLAQHYGLTKSDVQAYSGTDATTSWLFMNGDVDALFRVRAPGDASIDKLIRDADGAVIAIPQAHALQFKRPALEAGSIPVGSYKGWPTVPSKDIETVAVKRLLLARKDLPDAVVAKLTSVLFQRRRELIDEVPLAGNIMVPDRSSGTFLPLHSGAEAFYDRNQPSFLQENAEPIALLVSVFVVLMSALYQLNAQRRRRFLDAYNQELLELAQKARTARSFRTIDECHTQLSEFVQRIVAAAGAGRINSHEFNLFNFTYEAVEDAIRDRELQLERKGIRAKGRTARLSAQAKRKAITAARGGAEKPPDQGESA
ncbi:MAG: TAXI family TRAP transporter solute-binding subunit [Hyphomicrobiaceae bacterium]|nr:TAXI family TRAP transporter solute-binding subunit [Hyphomicrobiaceae bacterium]